MRSKGPALYKSMSSSQRDQPQLYIPKYATVDNLKAHIQNKQMPQCTWHAEHIHHADAESISRLCLCLSLSLSVCVCVCVRVCVCSSNSPSLSPHAHSWHLQSLAIIYLLQLRSTSLELQVAVFRADGSGELGSHDDNGDPSQSAYAASWGGDTRLTTLRQGQAKTRLHKAPQFLSLPSHHSIHTCRWIRSQIVTHTIAYTHYPGYVVF